MKDRIQTHITFFNQDVQERFDAVHIILWNKSAASIKVNDNLLLDPGDKLDLGCHPEVIDVTPYRLQFPNGGQLTVIYKTLS